MHMQRIKAGVIRQNQAAWKSTSRNMTTVFRFACDSSW